MSPDFDVVVLGQGLAGTALAWFLRWAGARVLVVDSEPLVTSSKIAAGLITPITGQKLVKTWRHAELWPDAVAFYRRVEVETGTRFFRRTSMVRLFASDAEASLFERRQTAEEFGGSVGQPTPLVEGAWFVADRSGFEMSDGGQLDVLQYLAESRQCFRRDGGYLAEHIDVSCEIELASDGVRLPSLGVSSKTLVFCQGIEAANNAWFRDVQFKPAKGEILTVRIPGLAEDRVIHRGIWLAPLGNDLFKAGSTYEWNPTDSLPTPHGRDEIIGRLCQFLRLPFEVVSHEAAIRPIHRNQYPVVGLHPVHSQLGYFNGLGSKGSLHAPFFARHFAERLTEGGAIDPDVDLNCKTVWSERPPGERIEGNPTSNTGRHVGHSTRRPLTQQAQDLIREVLSPGEIAIDATAGNGHDTQFLAERVGPRGTVYAFDIQQLALDKTAKRLIDANLQNVVLMNSNHSELSDAIPRTQHGRIAVVMFNLGYLPGGDKSVITRANTTHSGISQAVELLRPGGVLTILAYTGHDGGTAEARVVDEALDKLPHSEFEVNKLDSQPGRISGPRLFVVKRRTN